MEPPQKPNESDCCNSGCNPCILDVYEEQLQKYQRRAADAKSGWKKNIITPTTYTIFKVTNIVRCSPDTFLFNFKYPKDETGLNRGLFYKPGQHFLLKGHSFHDKTDQFTRAYTPLPFNNCSDDELKFTVLIKLYENGVMSQYIKNLQVNSETLWRGPYGSFEVAYTFSHMLLIAQGTGIAPLYSVIHDLVNNSDCETFLRLFFCCRREEDILLREELYKLSSFWNFSYKVFLSNAVVTVQCKYNETIEPNRLSKNEIGNYLNDEAKSNPRVLICGCEDFNQSMLEIVLGCGVDDSRTFVF